MGTGHTVLYLRINAAKGFIPQCDIVGATRRLRSATCVFEQMLQVYNIETEYVQRLPGDHMAVELMSDVPNSNVVQYSTVL
jgi:hypothetical protein